MASKQGSSSNWNLSVSSGRFIEHGQKPARVQHKPAVMPANSRVSPPPPAPKKSK